jgi:hypothetical protein
LNVESVFIPDARRFARTDLIRKDIPDDRR